MPPGAAAREVLRGLWQAPHRPLFLGAALCAFGTVAWWPLGEALNLPSPNLGPPVLWHAHELLFGFAGAAAGGYLLTAAPGWTGQPPLRGGALQLLVLLWLLARLAAAFAGVLPPLLLVPTGSGYFLLLAWHLLRAVASARAWRKLGFCFAMLALGGADVLFLASAAQGNHMDSLDIARGAVLLFALLPAVIGGKAVPAFTRNWLLARAAPGNLPPVRLPLPAAAALAGALLCEGLGWAKAGGWLLCTSAALLLWHMRGWRSWAVRAEPLLAALHLAYLWLPAGLGLIGLARLLQLPLSEAGALHAVTAGAMGGLVFAIAGRAAAHRRRNGLLKAGACFTAGAALIWLAAAARLAAAGGLQAMAAAGLLWSLGWTAFAAGFLPALRGPPHRPVLSGRNVRPSAVD
ncbi:NnrS family protein [Roseobacteraceae bacterium NS-SX3]